MGSFSAIINRSYSGEELNTLQKSIFPALILDLPKEVLDSEAAKEVNKKLSEVAFNGGVVKEQNLANIPLVYGADNSKETQLA